MEEEEEKEVNKTDVSTSREPLDNSGGSSVPEAQTVEQKDIGSEGVSGTALFRSEKPLPTESAKRAQTGAGASA